MLHVNRQLLKMYMKKKDEKNEKKNVNESKIKNEL